jgi:predicted sugar kinase
MDNILSKEKLKSFKAGFVINTCRKKTVREHLFHEIRLRYPSRINAMAIDPSKIAIDMQNRYTPGEILFVVDIPLNVRITLRDDDLINIDHPRVALIYHAIGLMHDATGFKNGMDISISGEDIPHSGFGSSSRLIAAVSSAINELQGCPLSNDELQVYLAENHGEEIKDNDTELMPVQCIGGGASAGLHKGGVQIISGSSVTIVSYDIPDSYRVVIGYPAKQIFNDSQEAFDAELDNITQFLNIGKIYGEKIAYRVLHEMIPAFASGDLTRAGEVIEWYRYQLGSNIACSFSHPKLLEWADKLHSRKNELNINICGISSVGPALYAITQTTGKSEQFFEELGLQHKTVRFWNDTYRILEKQ